MTDLTLTRPPQAVKKVDDAFEREFQRFTEVIEMAEELDEVLALFDHLREGPKDVLLKRFDRREHIESYVTALAEEADELEKALGCGNNYARRVKARLITLIGEFGNLSPHNAEIFLKSLTQHVLLEKPSALELESACRAMVKNKEFFSIAAIIEELGEAKEKWKRLRDRETILEQGREMARDRAEAEQAFTDSVLYDLNFYGHAKLAAAVQRQDQRCRSEARA
jgi:hypothetical protein